MQFVKNVLWFQAGGFEVHYHVGIDGISLFLILMTTFLMPISVLGSWSVTEKLRSYMILMLLLEVGMVGVFVSLDLILFYFFWEAQLIPMYFLIGIWGGKNRIYAAVKFFIYTMFGSLLMLAALISLFFLNRAESFDIVQITEQTGQWRNFPGIYGGGAPISGLLPRVRHQGSPLSLPHLAPRRARGSSYRRISDSGGRPVEDGNLWLATLLPADVSSCRRGIGAADLCSGDRRDHLWCASRHGATGRQETGGLFLSKPPGFCRSRYFCFQYRSYRRSNLPDAESWGVQQYVLVEQY